MAFWLFTFWHLVCALWLQRKPKVHVKQPIKVKSSSNPTERLPATICRRSRARLSGAASRSPASPSSPSPSPSPNPDPSPNLCLRVLAEPEVRAHAARDDAPVAPVDAADGDPPD
eukprot:scaffold42727_cov55-Phaeocystis_antarctica.AAC.3